ncbi:MAG: FAD:protein FMN transferase [Armatimonadota bacterium]
MNILKAFRRPVELPYQFHYEGVLGTSASFRFDTSDAKVAEEACNIALERIAQLESIFSSYNPASTLMQWQGTQKLPQMLCAILDSAELWRTKTGGAFAPGVTHPNACWEKLSENTYRRLDVPAFTLNAIAKGAIVDDVAATIERQYPEISQSVVNIGGDLYVRGRKSVKAGVQSSDDSASPQTVIGLCNQAIATSGTARRGLHILDPRTSTAVTHTPLVSVVAPSAQLADILSTACSVLTIQESLALIASTPYSEVRLVDAQGHHFRSSGWSQLEHQACYAC